LDQASARALSGATPPKHIATGGGGLSPSSSRLGTGGEVALKKQVGVDHVLKKIQL